jgi:sarcosine oxidase subunit beta
MDSAGVRMPLESYPLQALVSEPVKPVFPCVVMSNTVHAYISQSDKGELVIGSGTDQYTSYSQTGGLPLIEHTLAAICEVFPIFTRMRMLRLWGGIVDVTPDRSCILGKTPVPGLYVNCGWGTGGFKATPGAAHTLAWTMARTSRTQDQRALHAGALHHRPPDRRGRRGGGGALRRGR